MADLPLLATITGEAFQPVRLHYKILNRSRLLRAFKTLRCLDYDSPRKRWVWLYEHEAKGLRFQRSYNQIPREQRPLILGSFFLREQETLLLDLRSFDRALHAIPFFDRHLPRKVVKLKDAEIVNRLFDATPENTKLSPDVLFDSQVGTDSDSENLRDQLARLAGDAQGLKERMDLILQELQSRSSKPLPEIERLPINFPEDGIHGFRLALRLRELVARQHWEGNPEYSLTDAIDAAIRTP